MVSKKLSREEWGEVLHAFDEGGRELLAEKAREAASQSFGNRVYLRALIEISSFCRNGCRYCGLRCGNRLAVR